jgi:tetratricopeptide (TPR) repeat protein
MLYSIKLFLITILFFSGCSAISEPSVKKGHEKSFEYEDVYIMTGLYLEELQDYNSSSKMFETLFLETNKKEYLYRSLKNDLVAQKFERVVQRVDLEKNIEDDYELMKIKVVALIKLDMAIEAKKLAIRLGEISKNIDDYLLAADVYTKLQEYENAVAYLENIYVTNPHEKIIDRITTIMYVDLDRKKDAITQLEAHSRIYSCSEFICNKLIGFYSNENDLDALLSTYLRVYKLNENVEIAKKIIQIYGYKRDYKSMREFLQENKIDKELLLQLYIQEKDYKKATSIAKELYEETKNIMFLAQSAIFEYESSEDKNNKKMLDSVVSKLKEVVKTDKDAMSLNYLGYLLIDHDIDIKQGMKYIEEVLKIDPNSAYYLDSLAWGYYKLKNCKEALKIMKRVQKLEGGDNEEVLKHIEMIEKCNKNTKGMK